MGVSGVGAGAESGEGGGGCKGVGLTCGAVAELGGPVMAECRVVNLQQGQDVSNRCRARAEEGDWAPLWC